MSLGIPLAIGGTFILAWFDQFNERRLPALLCYGFLALGAVVAFAESAFFEDALLRIVAGAVMLAVQLGWYLLMRFAKKDVIGLGDILIYSALVMMLPNSGSFALFIKTLFYSVASHSYFAILSLKKPDLGALLSEKHAMVPHIFMGLVAALVIP